MHRQSQRTRVIIAILSVLILISMVLAGVASVAGASPALDSGRSQRSEQAHRAEVGDTTTTLPEDHRVFGKSITRPNEGMHPQDPGDPGGWLQSSLFFIICGTVILLALGLSYRSRTLREKRKAAGLDPVDLARKRGEGVRMPSPLDQR